MTWLEELAHEDGVTLEEAAAYLVTLGVQLTVEDYVSAGRPGRAALIAARVVARAPAAEVDERTVARRAAEKAGHAVANALAAGWKPYA